MILIEDEEKRLLAAIARNEKTKSEVASHKSPFHYKRRGGYAFV